MENRYRFYISDNTVLTVLVIAATIFLGFQSTNYRSAQEEFEGYKNSVACVEISPSVSESIKQCKQILTAKIVNSKVVEQNLSSFQNSRIDIRYFLVLLLSTSQVKNVELLDFANLESEKFQYAIENQPFISTFDTPFVFDNLPQDDMLEVESWNNKITLVYLLSPLGDKIAIPTTDYPEYVVSSKKNEFYSLAFVLAFAITGLWFYLKIFMPRRRGIRKRAKL